VTSVEQGREKLHHLNPAPIDDIAERWIRRYDQGRIDALADLRRAFEDTDMETETTPDARFVCDGFQPDSAVLRGVSGGWVRLLSDLKTQLETGETLPAD
jgi:hypothetical protein